MKKKVFNKKLSLNKETIANLSNSKMISIKGGLPPYTGNPCVGAEAQKEFDEEYESMVNSNCSCIC